jgi:CDP-paratose 2-epimerase
VTGEQYTVFGYGGKQVRDNIHSGDVVRAFHAFHRNPRSAAVYNLGGGRESNVSMIEAIALCEEFAGKGLDYSYSPEARIGDHRWWISDLGAFKRNHPQWRLTRNIRAMLQEIHDHNVERWSATRDVIVS